MKSKVCLAKKGRRVFPSNNPRTNISSNHALLSEKGKKESEGE